MKLPSLIPEWRLAWRFTSVQAAAVLVFLSMLQAEVLPFLQPLVPARYWPFVCAGVGLLIIVFRLISQNGLRVPKEPGQ